MVFVDFSKAFDSAGKTGLWQLLRKYDCPEKFTTMIHALHTGMMANVSVGGEVSESFGVTFRRKDYLPRRQMLYAEV